MDEKETIAMLEILVENAKQMQEAVKKVETSANVASSAASSLRSTMREGLPQHCMMSSAMDQNRLRRIMSDAVADRLGEGICRLESTLEKLKRALKLMAATTAMVASTSVLAISFSAAASSGSLQDGFWQICAGLGVLMIIVILVALVVSAS